MQNTQSIIWSQLAIDYKCEFAEGGYQFSRSKTGEPKRLITNFAKPDILARKFTSECLRDFLSIYPGYSKYEKSKELITKGLEDFHSKWGVFPTTDNEPNFVEGSEASLLLIVKKRRYLTRYKRDSDQYDAEFEESDVRTATAQVLGSVAVATAKHGHAGKKTVSATIPRLKQSVRASRKMSTTTNTTWRIRLYLMALELLLYASSSVHSTPRVSFSHSAPLEMPPAAT